MGHDPATLILIILASDKTVLSSLSGEVSAWPVYIRDGIRSVPDREQTDTELRFIGLGQVGLLLQYNRSISEYNVGRF